MRRFVRSVRALTAIAVLVPVLVLLSGPASAAPTAEFTFAPTAPVIDQPVTFTFAGSCDVAPCRIQWKWFSAGGSSLGNTMGEGLVLTYAFADAGTFSVVAKITNATSTTGTATVTHAIRVVPAVVAVPSVPRGVTAVSPTSNQVDVSWASPELSGSGPVIGYLLRLSAGVETRTTSVSATERTLTFLDVAPGPATVDVRARNAYGDSGAVTAAVSVEGPPTPALPVEPAASTSPPVATASATPAAVATPVTEVVAPRAPDAPSGLVVTEVVAGGVTHIRWATPAAGAMVTRYRVTVDGRLRVLRGVATSMRVRGLRAGPARILVRAVNAAGSSPATTTTITVSRSLARPPTTTLAPGTTGAAVTRLQRALGMSRQSGRFDPRTRQAVLAYQRAHRLARTGVAADRMRYLLAV